MRISRSETPKTKTEQKNETTNNMKSESCKERKKGSRKDLINQDEDGSEKR